jgi:predicted Zn finger-like uncharacterized protein
MSMTIDAPCPNCGTIYTVRRELIGKRTKCTRCGTPFVIAEVPPTQAPPASPPPPPEQGLFADIPIHPSYAPHTAPPAAEQAGPGRRSAHDSFGFEDNNSQPRYTALKMVARGYEVLAILILIIAVVALVIGIVRVILDPHAIVAVLVSSGMMFVWGLATALMCLFFSQVTRLALQVEQNTRDTAQACRQLADHLTAIQVDE